MKIQSNERGESSIHFKGKSFKICECKNPINWKWTNEIKGLKREKFKKEQYSLYWGKTDFLKKVPAVLDSECMGSGAELSCHWRWQNN